MIPILTALLALVAGSPAEVRPTPGHAACAAQAFLRANGYLDTAPTLAAEDLQLELWDGVTYWKDGVFDYATMIRDRRNLYSGRLQGVLTEADGYFSVVYRLEGQRNRGRSCLVVTPDLRSVVIMHATCTPQRPVKRFSERRLSCPSPS